jgi:hypothetical protein
VWAVLPTFRWYTLPTISGSKLVSEKVTVYIRPIDLSSNGTREIMQEGASTSSPPTGTMDKESFDGANCTETHLSYFYTEDGGSMYL